MTIKALLIACLTVDHWNSPLLFGHNGYQKRVSFPGIEHQRMTLLDFGIENVVYYNFRDSIHYCKTVS